MKPDRFFRQFLIPVIFLMVRAGEAQVIYRNHHVPPYSGGASQLIGDIEYLGNGEAAAVFSRPAGTRLDLMFYRFGPDAEVRVQKQHSIDPLSFYTPALCRSVDGFGVVWSTYTRGKFMVLDTQGDIAVPPFDLPNIPVGGRGAAFRVLWLGNAYAVFGCWLEPEYPGQNPSYGNFYTHLMYWLLDRNGALITHRELKMLAPMTYPSIEGAEKGYYDVVWTGASFFIAYYSESQTGPPLSIYYRLFDINGNLIRAEAPCLAHTTAMGTGLAWNGQTVALTCLHEQTMVGNTMYVRFFAPDGTPRGDEMQYGDLLGFGPTVFWEGNRFVTAYCMIYDWNNVGYTWLFNEFREDGRRVRPEYPLKNLNGQVMTGTMTLGFDLEFVGGDGRVVFGKAQTSDPYYITNSPLVIGLYGDGIPDRRDVFDLAGHWGAPFDFPDLLALIERMRNR